VGGKHNTGSIKVSVADFQKIAKEMVANARASLADLPSGLPDEPTTEGQAALAAKHGTPQAFAKSLIQVVGEISPNEARRAVARYLEQWNAA
jgi:hypothetical protein